MRKFMFAVLAIAAITLTGCSKDDESNNPLSGTTWRYEETIYGTICIRELKFISNTECMGTWSEDNSIMDTHISGSEMVKYTYAHPVVYFYSLDGQQTVTATIDGNTLTTKAEVEGWDGRLETEYMEFIKQ